MDLTQIIGVAPQGLSQESIDALLKAIQTMPVEVKTIVTASLQENFRGFVASNFILSTQIQDMLASMPDEVNAYHGFVLAMALNLGWNVSVGIPAGVPSPQAACKVTEKKITVERDFFNPGHSIYGFKLKFVF